MKATLLISHWKCVYGALFPNGKYVFEVLEKTFPTTHLPLQRALVSSSIFNQPAHGNRGNLLIDESGRCTWACSVLLLLLSTLGLSLSAGSFYFLLHRPPKGSIWFSCFSCDGDEALTRSLYHNIKSHSVTFSNTGISV